MHVSRRYPTRLVLAIAIAATVLVIGAAAAFGQGAPHPDQPVSGGGVSGMTGTTVASPPDVGRVLRDRDRRSGVVLRNIGGSAGTHHGRAGDDRRARPCGARRRDRCRGEGCDGASHHRGRCRRHPARFDHRHAGLGDALLRVPDDGRCLRFVARITRRWRRHGARPGARRLPRLRERHGHLGAELTPGRPVSARRRSAA